MIKGDEGEMTFSDMMGSPDMEMLSTEFDIALGHQLTHWGLDEREKTIFYLYHLQEYSQTEVAEHLGTSQVHISRLLKRLKGKIQFRPSEGLDTLFS